MMRQEDGTLVPSPDAEIVRKVLTIYVDGGKGFQATANDANAIPLRFRDRTGRRVPFDKSSVRSIVSNVLVYLGYIPTVRSKDMTLPDNLDTSHSLVDQMIEIYHARKGQIEPIITRSLAERVLATRLQRRELRIVRPRRIFILTPILYCAACGSEMRGQTHRNKPWYKHKTLSCTPGQGQHAAEELEHKVLSLFQGLKLPPGLIDIIRGKVIERLEKRPENEGVKQTLDHLHRKLNRLKELYLEGDMNREEYKARKATIQTQIAEWEAKLGPVDYDIEGILAKLNTLAEMLAQGTQEQQKRAINAAFERIEVGLDGEIKKAVPKPWFQPLFHDLAAALRGDLKCPQGNSNPCRHLERVVS